MRTIDKLKQPVKIRPPNMLRASPCATEISTLFNCWRALGVDSTGCANSAKALAGCMAQPMKASKKNSVDSINHWLGEVRKRKQL
ncbi:hypothetical protein HDV05_004739 [Chytridiales sp. JEL 0842]|nr:hypothetical protein HDV05_004739 [Chytridiales sp. JEL 0842]